MKAIDKDKDEIGIIPFRLFDYKGNKYFIYGKTLLGNILYSTSVKEDGSKVTISKPSKDELNNLYEAVNNVINNNIYDITFFDANSLENKKITILSEQPMALSTDKYNAIVQPLSVSAKEESKGIEISPDVMKDKKFIMISYMVLVFIILASILLLVLIFKNVSGPAQFRPR